MQALQAAERFIAPALKMLHAAGVPAGGDDLRMLVAVGAHETGFGYGEPRVCRDGFGVGWWNINGAHLRTVLAHPETMEPAAKLFAHTSSDPRPTEIMQIVQHDNALGACLANLLLRTDDYPMAEDVLGGYEQYVRCWRPFIGQSLNWGVHWQVGVAIAAVWNG